MIDKRYVVKRIHETAKNIFVSILSVYIFFTLLEYGCKYYIRARRMALPPLNHTFIENDESMFIFDPQLGFKMKPNFKNGDIKINSLGFRSSQEFMLTEDMHKKRIMLLGDSMVFGMHTTQDDIFSETLNRDAKEAVFYNTGVNGYDTAQEYLVLKNYVDRLKPSIVLLFYMQEGDMWWNVRGDRFYPRAKLVDKKLIILPAQDIDRIPGYKGLYIYRVLDKNYLMGKDLVYLYHKLGFVLKGESSSAWQVTRSILHEIGDICRVRNIKVVVIDIPKMRRLQSRSPADSQQRLLYKASSEEGFYYCDLGQLYPHNWKELFIKGDCHWNKAGHLFIVNVIRNILRDDRLSGNILASLFQYA